MLQLMQKFTDKLMQEDIRFINATLQNYLTCFDRPDLNKLFEALRCQDDLRRFGINLSFRFIIGIDESDKNNFYYSVRVIFMRKYVSPILTISDKLKEIDKYLIYCRKRIGARYLEQFGHKDLTEEQIKELFKIDILRYRPDENEDLIEVPSDFDEEGLIPQEKEPTIQEEQERSLLPKL